jgi:hypothetical protein
VPLLLLFTLPLLLVLVVTILMPLSLVQRYRVGTSRRRARGWVAIVNIAVMALSVVFFLTATAVASVWVPWAFTYSFLGMLAGGLLGVLGLRLTRWEATPHGLHYTPHRWLVLGVTLVVTTRVLYGLWRAWQTWRMGLDDVSWFAAAGIAGSFAAGAIVLGYYLTYWVGLRRRLAQYERMHGPPPWGRPPRRRVSGRTL